MKYIRTKDGIYEVIEFHTTTPEHESFISDYFCKGLITILAKEVIDISLSIEELCDEFVDVNSFCCSLLNENEKQDIKRFAKSNLFGAIWTDKGLIYVAKLNEKGELELI